MPDINFEGDSEMITIVIDQHSYSDKGLNYAIPTRHL